MCQGAYPWYDDTCSTHVLPGESCTPKIKESVCIEGRAPVLSCPADNLIERAPSAPSWASYPTISCKVCSIALSADSDIRPDTFTGALTFGPNQMNGQVDEADIWEYKIYFTDEIHRRLPVGAPEVVATVGVGSVPATSFTSLSGDAGVCCDHEAYLVSFSEVNLAAEMAKLMVVPVDSAGQEVPVGLAVDIVDYTTTMTTTASSSTGTVTTMSTTTTTFTTPTTTSTTTTSRTTTTTTIPSEVHVAGSMQVNVLDPCIFITDPLAVAAISQAISSVAGVAASLVDVSLSSSACASRRLSPTADTKSVKTADFVDASRLFPRIQTLLVDRGPITHMTSSLTRQEVLFSSGRRLSLGEVEASYLITILGDDLALGTAIRNYIIQTPKEQLSSILSGQMLTSMGQDYGIVVTSISEPTVVLVTLTSTTTTATSSTTTTRTVTESSAPTAATTTLTLKKAVDSLAWKTAPFGNAHVALVFMAAFMLG